MLAAEQAARGQYDPERIRAQQDLQDEFGPRQAQQQLDSLWALDPESQLVRQNLFGRVQSDLDSGYELPEEYDTELTSQIRGAQAARGNSLGTGAAGAEATFKGRAALDLYQQHLTNAGAFLAGTTPIQQLQGISAVQPDRSSAYVNPQAGYQGQNMGQANFQNQLALYQMQGGGRNPWQGALAGGASGAAAGASAGPWGALVGGVVGAGAGYFCDSRIKCDVIEVGKSPSGIPLVEFSYKSDPEKKRFRAAMAEDVRLVYPDAVFTDQSGFLTVNFAKTDVSFVQLT